VCSKTPGSSGVFLEDNQCRHHAVIVRTWWSEENRSRNSDSVTFHLMELCEALFWHLVQWNLGVVAELSWWVLANPKGVELSEWMISLAVPEIVCVVLSRNVTPLSVRHQFLDQRHAIGNANVFHLEACPWIHWSVILESDHNLMEAITKLRTVRVCATKFVSTTHSSNRGKDAGLIGAILLLAVNRNTLVSSARVTQR